MDTRHNAIGCAVYHSVEYDINHMHDVAYKFAIDFVEYSAGIVNMLPCNLAIECVNN